MISLTKLGAGTLVLNQANTYTGTTTITAGTIQLGSGAATGSLSTSSGINIGTGATFAVNQSDTVTQGTEFGFVGGLGGFTQAGSGTTVLNQANTFSGTTTVSAGTLSLTNALALQNSALVTTIGTSTMGAFSALTIGGLSGSRDLGSADVLFGYTGNVTALTLNPQTGVSVTYSGIISNGSGAMSLTKTGAGTQILTGANTYTGATIINAGTLTIGAGGSLSASSVLQINGGTFSYGNTAASQTLNGLAVGAGNSTVNNTAACSNPDPGRNHPDGKYLWHGQFRHPDRPDQHHDWNHQRHHRALGDHRCHHHAEIRRGFSGWQHSRPTSPHSPPEPRPRPTLWPTSPTRR